MSSLASDRDSSFLSASSAVFRTPKKVNVGGKSHRGGMCRVRAGRHTYITELLRNGASLPEAKELARHTDVKMTMRYTHIGLEDQSKAVAGLHLPAPEQQNPAPTDETSDGGALQMRCIFCSAGGHSLTSADTGEPAILNENPGVSRGYVATCHQVALPTNVEAPGIEPGSRCTSASASTCVARRFCRAEPYAFIARPSTSKENVRLIGQEDLASTAADAPFKGLKHSRA